MALRFPVTFHLGSLEVPAHPVFEAMGYAVGFQVFLFLRRRHGEVLTVTQRAALILTAIVGAIAGAKLLAWLEDPAVVWANRTDPRVWLAGKTIVGGLLGGWAAVELAKKRMGITRSTGDLYAIPLAIGIAIGRIGCFLTGLPDRTYGTHSSLPWAIDFGDGPRHPTQLYEMGILLLVMVPLLLRQRRVGHGEGDQFKLFMVGYLAWRLAVGFIQPAPRLILLSGIQWACLLGLIVLGPHLDRLVSGLRSPRPQPIAPEQV